MMQKGTRGKLRDEVWSQLTLNDRTVALQPLSFHQRAINPQHLVILEYLSRVTVHLSSCWSATQLNEDTSSVWSHFPLKRCESRNESRLCVKKVGKLFCLWLFYSHGSLYLSTHLPRGEKCIMKGSAGEESSLDSSSALLSGFFFGTRQLKGKLVLKIKPKTLVCVLMMRSLVNVQHFTRLAAIWGHDFIASQTNPKLTEVIAFYAKRENLTWKEKYRWGSQNCFSEGKAVASTHQPWIPVLFAKNKVKLWTHSTWNKWSHEHWMPRQVDTNSNVIFSEQYVSLFLFRNLIHLSLN